MTNWIWIIVVGWLVLDSIEWRIRFRRMSKRLAAIEVAHTLPIYETNVAKREGE